VRLDHLAFSELPTGVAGILVDDGGENLIAVASGANADVPGADVELALRALGGPGVVVVVNLELGDEAVAAAAVGAQRRGAPRVATGAPVGGRRRPALRAGRRRPLNGQGAAALRGGADGLLPAGARAVVVTAGAGGCTLVRAGEPPVHVPALAVDVVDTTGAGDAFTAGLAVALAAGHPPEQALRLASVVGGLSTRALGARAALPTRDEAEAALARLQQTA